MKSKPKKKTDPSLSLSFYSFLGKYNSHILNPVLTYHHLFMGEGDIWSNDNWQKKSKKVGRGQKKSLKYTFLP